MPRKSTTTAPVFNIDEYRVARHYDEREIEMAGGETLHVTLLHLTTREAKGIPSSRRSPLEDAYKACWQYVTDWDLTVMHNETGKEMALPAPGSPDAAGAVGEGNEWQLLEMLDNETGSAIVMWLTNPAGMKLATEMGKPPSSESGTTGEPSPSGTAAKT